MASEVDCKYPMTLAMNFFETRRWLASAVIRKAEAFYYNFRYYVGVNLKDFVLQHNKNPKCMISSTGRSCDLAS